MTLEEARTIKDSPADYSITRLIEALQTVFTELDRGESHRLEQARQRMLNGWGLS